MSIAAQVPGLDPRMLLAFGGGGGLEQLERVTARGSVASFLARLPVTAGRLLASNFGLDRRVRAFERAFDAARRRFATFDPAALSWPALGGMVDELEVLLRRTGTMMLESASSYLASVVVLQATLRRLGL